MNDKIIYDVRQTDRFSWVCTAKIGSRIIAHGVGNSKREASANCRKELKF